MNNQFFRGYAHTKYKKTIKILLMDFYIDSSKYFDGMDASEITLKDLNDFIEHWTNSHITETLGE